MLDMTFEQGVLGCLAAVVSALVAMFKMERDASRLREIACNERNNANEKKIREMERHIGRLESSALFVKTCPMQNCPFSNLLSPPSSSPSENQPQCNYETNHISSD